jgi:predicted acyltransferase
MERGKFELLSDTGILLRALASFAIAILVGAGVGGTAYKLAAPGGWLAQLFGRSLPGSLGVLLAFLVIVFCFWLMRGWMSRSGPDRIGELPVYLCAGAGTLYAFQLVMTL